MATETMARAARLRCPAALCGLLCAGVLAATGASAQAPGQSAITIAVRTAQVSEGEDAVFILTRSRPVGQSQKVRVSISGHDKIMSAATREMEFTEVQFARGAASAELRLTTEQDNRNEGDGDIRATIVRSTEHFYLIGSPSEAAVRVQDDDIPEVTLRVLSPEGLTLEGGTWVGEMPEGTKIAFEILCTGSYTYSHPFLPVLDHDHEFNHPFNDYNFAGYWSAPCNRQSEFPLSAGQSFTGPDGGEIRAHILSTTEIESRWKNGRIMHESGRTFIYFTCLEHDYGYCPRYTLGTPNALRVAVYNLNPTVIVAAEQDAVDEGEAARFVITRIWDHPGIFDYAMPGDAIAITRIGFRVAEAGGYVAAADIGEKQQDAFTFSRHEYVLEVPTIDDAVKRDGGTVTVELMPDSFPGVNIGGQYELYESLPGITPPGKSSIRATVSIRDNDLAVTVAMTEEAVVVEETAAAVSIGVTLSKAADQDVTVDYATRDRSGAPDGGEAAAATAGEDYTAGSGTLIFAPGETSKSVAIAIIDDTMDEPPERFEVALGNAQGASVGEPAMTTVTILPDDREAEPEASIEARRPEPVAESTGRIEFAVRLSAASGHVVEGTVYTASRDGDSAVMDADYRPIKGRTVRIPAGETEQIVAVELIDDDQEEDEIETFTIVLDNLTHARVRPQPGGDPDRSTATGAIADDDGGEPSPNRPYRIALKVRPPTVPESGASGPLTVTAQLVGGTEEWDTTVRVFVDRFAHAGNDVAVAPDDFAPVDPFEVVIPRHATTGSAIVAFLPVDDALDEAAESVTFRGEVIGGGSILRTGLPVTPATVTLLDDDRRGVTVSPLAISVDEGGPEAAGYTVVLRSQPTAAVTVAVELPAAAANVTATPLHLRFDEPNWNEAQTVSVRAGADDNRIDDVVTLSHLVTGGDYHGETARSVTVTVRDTTELDAGVALPVLSAEDARGTEGDGVLRFVVSLEPAARQPVTAAYATTSGTAVAGEDYEAAAGTVTFAAGTSRRTIVVALIDDDVDEADKDRAGRRCGDRLRHRHRRRPWMGRFRERPVRERARERAVAPRGIGISRLGSVGEVELRPAPVLAAGAVRRGCRVMGNAQ